jgi:hypothetical protein
MLPTLEDFRERLANTTISSSTLRNQGAPGIINQARHFLKDLDLQKFVTNDEKIFSRELDTQTDLLRLSFPIQSQHWGTARKAINLFLAESYYHKFVCVGYKLEIIEPFLELPLDSQVGKFLTKEAQKRGETDFPQWKGLKYLNPEESKLYQDFAKRLAKEKGYARVFLDVVIWQPEGIINSGNGSESKNGS